MKSKPLVSICIPTYKRPEIVKKTIKSILNSGVTSDILNICITDNSTTDETKSMIEEEFLSYGMVNYKKTVCPGFMNSIEALKYGDGEFLKLHNDYSKFKHGELEKFVNVIKKYQKEKPVMFFSMGALRKKHKIEEFRTFNDFMYDIHYYSTWSSAFGIWKDDFDYLLKQQIDMDKMFPHTSFLFMLTSAKNYIVDDSEYVDNLPLKKKGGYNLPDNFIRLYLNMVKHILVNEEISDKTYAKIESGIIRFVAKWYSEVNYNKDIYSFSFDNDVKIIRDICGYEAVNKYKAWKLCFDFKYRVKKLLKEW